LSLITRRNFLISSALAGGGVALAFQSLVHRDILASSLVRSSLSLKAADFGLLAPKKTLNTQEELLALPEGFEYTLLSRTGNKMTDGRPTPSLPDGMATFNVNGQLRLVRNHELNPNIGREGAALTGSERSYDTLASGGTTTLIVDPVKRELVQSFVSLSGTIVNCCGGPTPWGSWISCEETVLGQRKFKDDKGTDKGGFDKPHGYCFEVSAAANTNGMPVPLKDMGRFVHEAIAVDPKTKVVYETEDRVTAGFYRFLPNKPGQLARGGKLQMLAVKDKAGADLRTGQKQGATYETVWVDIANPDPPEAETDEFAVYKQGIAKGAATFARLEGCWAAKDGRIYFTSTIGGDEKLGQVWEYAPQSKTGGKLTLIFESTDSEILDGPDNICIHPRGHLFICEDGTREKDLDNYVRVINSKGQISDFAKNVVPKFENKEFCGATFSPDGKTLFVNIQIPGLTFAIWGDWGKSLK
jgi:hypothetical protein